MIRIQRAGCESPSLECIFRVCESRNQVIIEDLFYIIFGGKLLPWPIDETIREFSCEHGKVEGEESGYSERVRIRARGIHGWYCIECVGDETEFICYPCPQEVENDIKKVFT